MTSDPVADSVRLQVAEQSLSAAERSDHPALTDLVVSAYQESMTAHGHPIGVRQARQNVADLIADVSGSGAALRSAWERTDVSDVLVNGPREVWVDQGSGLRRIECDVGDVRALATRLAALSGQRLDDAAPIVDGRLPDGTRLHAVLAPVAAGGAYLSLRRHRQRSLTLQEWCDGGGLGPRGLAVLRALVAARANLIISGGTGSGKTTLLASLLGCVAASERVVCIEEARELEPDHPHVVHLQARGVNVQGAGEVPLAQLVRAAMRMRPDRLVLGECRGGEVREVLLALNTGHDGGMVTVHANTAGDVPTRLIALGSLAQLDSTSVALQAGSALDAVLHLRRNANRRVVSEVAVLVGHGDELRTELALRWSEPESDLVPAAGWARLAQILDSNRQGT